MIKISSKKLLSILLVLFIFISTVNILPVSALNIWAVYFEGEDARNAGEYQLAIEKYEAVIDTFVGNEDFTNSALIYGKLAKCYGELEDYDKAVENWEKESYYWGKSDKIQEQKAAMYKADKFRSDVKIFTELSSNVAGEQYYHGAKYEPVIGAYIGAYAEMDPAVHDPAAASKHYIHDFPTLTGKKHASYLIYTSYGLPFTTYQGHYSRAKEENVAIQLALQPINGLDEVKDDEYLRQFARDAKASGIPIFLRFANEMNGDWTHWSVTPEKYIEKFRLVAKVFKEEAPNVVMVWAPNWFPEENVDDYYPGDNYVDWVGVSMYNNYQPEADPLNKGVDRGNYLDKFDKIYNKYSPRKPVFISEGGISYTHIKTGDDVTSWAANEIKKFYAYLPVLYPGVKGYYWFDKNNDIDGSLRSYLLSSNSTMLNSYKKAISNPFYLSNINDKSSVFYGNVGEYGIGPNNQKILSYIKTVDPEVEKVVYKIDGKVIGQSTSLPWSIEYNFAPYFGKEVTIEVEAIGKGGKVLTKKDVSAFIGYKNSQGEGYSIFDYDKLSDSLTTEEILKVIEDSFLSLTTEQKEDNDIKEEIVKYAEYAISKIGEKEVKAVESKANINLETLNQSITDVEGAKENIEKIISDNGINKNREIFTEVKLNVSGLGKSGEISLNKDIVNNTKDIDNIKLDTGDVQITLDARSLREEIGNNENITIEINEEEPPKTAIGSSETYLVLSDYSNFRLDGDLLASNMASIFDKKVFSVSFKTLNKVKDKILNKVKLGLPLAKGEPEYNAVFIEKNGVSEPVGGKYNNLTGKIEIYTKESAKYYVMENKKTFKDIDSKDEIMKKAVEVLAAKGILGGKGDGVFDPNAPIKRSEFTKIIVRALYILDREAGADFTDVSKNAWYYPYVASSKKEGLINGYQDLTFRGNNVITKQEIIKVSAATLNSVKKYYYPQNEDIYLQFTDKKNIPGWVKQYTALAAREGILVKRADGKFNGSQPSTRGDAAIMLYRLFNKL